MCGQETAADAILLQAEDRRRGARIRGRPHAHAPRWSRTPPSSPDALRIVVRLRDMHAGVGNAHLGEVGFGGGNPTTGAAELPIRNGARPSSA